MTWAKLSDDWADHPDIIAVSRSARLLHLEALLWSLAQNQDGAIPARALGRITDADDPQADAAELVESGAWVATDAGWQLVNSMDDQPTAEEIDRQRQFARDRQARRRRHMAGDHALCKPEHCKYAEGVTQGVTRDSRGSHPHVTAPRTDPTRPDRREGEGGEVRGRSAPSAGAPGAARLLTVEDFPMAWEVGR